MPITLTPETEQRLMQIAARRGTSPDSLVEKLLTQSLGEYSDFAPNENRADTPEDRLSPQALAESVAGLRQSFADAEAGRLTDAADVFADSRKKVGL